MVFASGTVVAHDHHKVESMACDSSCNHSCFDLWANSLQEEENDALSSNQIAKKVVEPSLWPKSHFH